MRDDGEAALRVDLGDHVAPRSPERGHCVVDGETEHVAVAGGELRADEHEHAPAIGRLPDACMLDPRQRRGRPYVRVISQHDEVELGLARCAEHVFERSVAVV